MRINLLGQVVLVAVAVTFAGHPPTLHAQAPSRVPPQPGAAGSRPATALPVHATRQSAFTIPFAVDRRVAQPVEVHLYVSTDQGANWQLYARQPPQASQFSFRSSGDGEYWFASRTLDAAQRARPQGPVQVELRVAVDTVPPQLEFHASVVAGGEVLMSWQAFDQNLLPSSLKIEYQELTGEPWKPITVSPPSENAVPNSYHGQMTWRPELAVPSVHLRAEIQDRAGNLTVVNRRLLLPQSGSPSTATDSRFPPPTSNPFARYDGPSSGAVAWPTDHPAAQQPSGGNSAWPIATAPFGPPRPEGSHVPTAPTSTGVPAGVPETGLPAREVSGGAAGWPGSSPPQSGGSHRPVPPGERPQMTNATRFRLEYDVDSVGPSGVAEVQLWATADGGQTWRLWGVDEDRESPFDVAVEDEGIFGFRVVIVSQHGLSGRKPRAGELADIWVGVDTTPPEARLTSATYGQGAQAGKLLIAWQAADSYLGDRPITLLFSESPNGPWTVIASALPHTGEFAWPADPQLPADLYLRLEVRDEAGNQTVDQLSEPIRIEGLAPKARIRGVQPLQDADREAFRQPRRG